MDYLNNRAERVPNGEKKDCTGTLSPGMSFERKELLFHKLAVLQLSPQLYTIGRICQKLGITRPTYLRWIHDRRYIKIKNSYLSQVRDQWEGNIQAVVINRAIKGSKFHIDTFYKLQGRFIERVEHTKKEVISGDPQEVNDEIDRLMEETQDLQVKGE